MYSLLPVDVKKEKKTFYSVFKVSESNNEVQLIMFILDSGSSSRRRAALRNWYELNFMSAEKNTR